MKRRTTYVRTMPKLYGNLQRKPFPWPAVFRAAQVLAAAVLVGGMLYAVWLSPWFKVTAVRVEGASVLSEASVRGAIPLGSNLLFLRAAEHESRLRETVAIRQVSVVRVLPREVRIRVVEREPVLVWMSGDVASLVDSAGLVFAQYSRAQLPSDGSPLALKLAVLPRVYDPKAVPVPNGTVIAGGLISGGVTQALAAMADELPTYPVDHVEIGETAYDLLIVTKSGMRAWLNLWDVPDVQVRNLARLVRRGSVSATAQVDLRVDGRAYVR